MKRACLHSILMYTMIFITPMYGQSSYMRSPEQGSYFVQSFTLSDFGDGIDAAKSLVWKPKFSEYAVQSTNTNDQTNANQTNQNTEQNANQTAGDDQAVGGADNNNQNADNANANANNANANNANANNANANNANANNANSSSSTNNQPQHLGNNPDPERNNIRYTQTKPEGVTEIIAGPQKYVLGVKAAFTRQGYNWIELMPYRLDSATNDISPEEVEHDTTNKTPAEVYAAYQAAVAASAGDNIGSVDAPPSTTAPAKSYPIPFAGIAKDITMWVWGGYYGWWVESYVIDYLGYQYRLPMGDLLYTGWKQKRVGVPESIIQTRRRVPFTQSPLVFEMIKLWSFPEERVNQFYAYFDLLQYTSTIPTDVVNGEVLDTFLW